MRELSLSTILCITILLLYIYSNTYAEPHVAGVCDSCKKSVAATGLVVSVHKDSYGATCWTSGTPTNQYMTLLNARFKAAKYRPLPNTTNKAIGHGKYNPKLRTNQ